MHIFGVEIVLFYTNTIAQIKRLCSKTKMGFKMIGTSVFKTLAPFPCEDNDAEPFSKMFYEIGEPIVRDLRPFLYK
jgi:hypothetical protein